MDGDHVRLLHAEPTVQRLGDRGDAVGGCNSRRKSPATPPVPKSRRAPRPLRFRSARTRTGSLAAPSGEVLSQVFLATERAGAFQHQVHGEVAPRQLDRVAPGEYRNLPAADNRSVTVRGDRPLGRRGRHDLDYLRLTGRPEAQVALVEAYAGSRASGTTWATPRSTPGSWIWPCPARSRRSPDRNARRTGCRRPGRVGVPRRAEAATFALRRHGRARRGRCGVISCSHPIPVTGDRDGALDLGWPTWNPRHSPRSPSRRRWRPGQHPGPARPPASPADHTAIRRPP